MDLQKYFPFTYLLGTKRKEVDWFVYEITDQPQELNYQLEFYYHPKKFYGRNSFVSRIQQIEIAHIENFILFHSKEASNNSLELEAIILLQMSENLSIYNSHSYVLLFRLLITPFDNIFNMKSKETLKFKLKIALKAIEERLKKVKSEIELDKFVELQKSKLEAIKQFDKLLNKDEEELAKYILEIYYVLIIPIYDIPKRERRITIQLIAQNLKIPLTPKVLKILEDENKDFLRNIKRKDNQSNFKTDFQLKRFIEINSE
jgi:hypothetical protein